MKFYSYAGESRGLTDPEDVYFFEVENGECHISECLLADKKHYVLKWDGNEHTLQNSWITCPSDTLIDLEDAR